MADDDLTFLGYAGHFKNGKIEPQPDGAVDFTIVFTMKEGEAVQALQRAMTKAYEAAKRRAQEPKP